MTGQNFTRKTSHLERRTKGEYSTEELRIFEEGKCEALSSILTSLHPENTDIWEKQLYSSRELYDFVWLEICNLRDRLKKARRIYIQSQRIIQNLTQLQID